MNEKEPIDGEVLEHEPGDSDLAVPTDVLPNTLHILPLSERPFFPAQGVPLLMNQEPWAETMREIGDTAHRLVGLVLTDATEPENARARDFRLIGTVARVHNPMNMDGKIQFIAEGIQRIRIVRWLSDRPPFLAQVEYPEEPLGNEDELRAYGIAIINTLKELVPLNPLYSEELKFFLNRFSPNEPSALADFAASLTTASSTDQQNILETLPVLRRMERVLVLIKKELEVVKLQSQIHQQVEQKMSEQQRKFFLNEQLKAIQQELGIAKDDRTADMDRFRARIETLSLPDEARERIDEEMQKFSVLESGSPEYAVTRNYLDWMSALPWRKYTKDNLKLAHARTILDEDHEGLEDVKDRIIEFLAIGKLKGEISGSIILLVGPPGVGKTSIGKSIAEALGRQFYRFSLGGMRDEAEIKGHRRTYIGAMPGKFIQALKSTESANPVIMLDEIDKIGASYLGDPASALLEALDPEQNTDFLDHYLDVRFDLSKVLFICTANQLDTIPGPLLDRMEIIHLAGYITSEKVRIARRHLWPRLLERSGITSRQLKITDAALRKLVEGYARESGVRNLEKKLGQIARKAAVRLVRKKTLRLSVGVNDLESYLGKPLFTRRQRASGVGVVTGLAWTRMGGATLDIEAARVHTLSRGFKLTGKLGEVMKESAEIAYSYIVSHLSGMDGKADYFDRSFVHLHVPEGATPKDGPSAGITMATALLSLARNERIKRPLAMTGELTLTGQVLPVGGIREKVTAARRNGISTIILPHANQRDFEELPDHLRDGIEIHFAKKYRDVYDVVFGSRD